MSQDLTPTPLSAEVIENPWKSLRTFTNARIGLGRTGVSLPTHEMLAFQLAHAQAKDAVHFPLDVEELKQQLQVFNLPVLSLHSRAMDRFTYLQRPDLGRRLNDVSVTQLENYAAQASLEFDLAIVLVDGLSSKAVQQNTCPFLAAFLDDLQKHPQLKTLRIAPISLVEQGRVALGDEVGMLLKAKLVVVLIGERPGLSSPDSLGLYLTWHPLVGRNDAQRNCISNIRPAGLTYKEASQKAVYLVQESYRLELTGVHLKDRSHEKTISDERESKNFLLG